MKLSHNDHTVLYEKSERLKKILDITFNTSMALLLLYLFNPFKKPKPIDNVVKSLLFLYAFILLLSNFEYYINENIVIEKLNQIKHFFVT